MRDIRKINGHKSAHRRSGLVHQPAGLAKVDVLGILRNLCNLHRRCFLSRVKVVEDGADQDLERRRGGKPRAFEHVAGGVGVKSADLHPQLPEPRGNPADQRSGAVGFFLPDRKIGKVDGIHWVAGRLDTDNAFVVFAGDCDDIKVDPCREHPSMLMVGVVAAHLGTSGRGKQFGFPFPEQPFKFRCRAGITFGLTCRIVFIKVFECAGQRARPDLLLQLFGTHCCLFLHPAGG